MVSCMDGDTLTLVSIISASNKAPIMMSKDPKTNKTTAKAMALYGILGGGASNWKMATHRVN